MKGNVTKPRRKKHNLKALLTLSLQHGAEIGKTKTIERSK
jgi:hypothetical protein